MSLFLIPLGLQALVISLDEFIFHHKRGLPRWERWGHPADTLSLLLCLGVILLYEPSQALGLYGGLAVFSSLLITKDEWIHHEHSSPMENWLHALLFVLHPVSLYCFFHFWWQWKVGGDPAAAWIIYLSAAGIFAFFLYQLVYWNFIRPSEAKEI